MFAQRHIIALFCSSGNGNPITQGVRVGTISTFACFFQWLRTVGRHMLTSSFYAPLPEGERFSRVKKPWQLWLCSGHLLPRYFSNRTSTPKITLNWYNLPGLANLSSWIKNNGKTGKKSAGYGLQKLLCELRTLKALSALRAGLNHAIHATGRGRTPPNVHHSIWTLNSLESLITTTENPKTRWWFYKIIRGSRFGFSQEHRVVRTHTTAPGPKPSPKFTGYAISLPKYQVVESLQTQPLRNFVPGVISI